VKEKKAGETARVFGPGEDVGEEIQPKEGIEGAKKKKQALRNHPATEAPASPEGPERRIPTCLRESGGTRRGETPGDSAQSRQALKSEPKKRENLRAILRQKGKKQKHGPVPWGIHTITAFEKKTRREETEGVEVRREAARGAPTSSPNQLEAGPLEHRPPQKTKGTGKSFLGVKKRPAHLQDDSTSKEKGGKTTLGGPATQKIKKGSTECTARREGGDNHRSNPSS